MNARRDGHRLVRRRQQRRVFHIGDGGTSIGYCPAVRRARCAEVARGQNIARRFKPVAPQTEEDFRVARQPTHLGANRRRLAGIQRRRQRRANAVGAGVSVVGGAHMQTVGAVVVAIPGLEAGIFVVALRHPAAHPALEAGV